jgi:hypothetical protein
VKLLIKFFSKEGNQGYLRGLAEEFQESTNSVRVELNRLSEAGLLVSQTLGKTKSYSANPQHPLFMEIKSIVAKYLGFDHLLEQVVKNLGTVKKAIIVGDYARGRDTGVIELVLVGESINFEYLQFLVEKAEQKIDRKVLVKVLDQDPGNSLEGMVVYDV